MIKPIQVSLRKYEVHRFSRCYERNQLQKNKILRQAFSNTRNFTIRHAEVACLFYTFTTVTAHQVLAEKRFKNYLQFLKDLLPKYDVEILELPNNVYFR